MKILLTGGAGFIGSNIAEVLLESGIEKLRIIDNLSTGKITNIQHLIDKYDNLEFIKGDITDEIFCKNAVKDMDIICHQAALGSVPRSINDPLNSHNSNVNGFLNILLAAKNQKIKRIVYASSSSIYGDSDKLPKVEEIIGKPLSPYAITKYIDELYAYIFTKLYDMEIIGLRYFNIFGPRQDPNGMYAAVIPKFINLMKNSERPIINGDGTFSRDFTFVKNAVNANVLAMNTKNNECFGEAFNIGCGDRHSINDLITGINHELGTNIIPKYGPNRPGDVPHSHACIDKAKRMLGYDVEVEFKNGLSKTIKYITNYI